MSTLPTWMVQVLAPFAPVCSQGSSANTLVKDIDRSAIYLVHLSRRWILRTSGE
jgi:hypothetical protein